MHNKVWGNSIVIVFSQLMPVLQYWKHLVQGNVAYEWAATCLVSTSIVVHVVIPTYGKAVV